MKGKLNISNVAYIIIASFIFRFLCADRVIGRDNARISQASFQKTPHVEITLADSSAKFLRIDSSTLSEAWVCVLDEHGKPITHLTKKDFHVVNQGIKAEIISIDTTQMLPLQSLAISFVLDNSSSMFHAYDSLTEYLDDLTKDIPNPIPVQCLVFDDKLRNRDFIITRREDLYIAIGSFSNSLDSLRRFWHFYDNVRTNFTPLYDALGVALSSQSQRNAMDKNDRQNILIVVTDGADNASNATLTDLIELEKKSHTFIYAVNYQTEIDRRLEYFVRHARGSLYLADDLPELRSTLDKIKKNIRYGYHLRYRFPNPSPGTAPH